MSYLARLARDRLSTDQIPSTGLSSEAYGGSWKTVSQSRGSHQVAHRPANVGVQVVPDQHDRAAKLPVRGIEQPA
jgi:hypothetical protein